MLARTIAFERVCPSVLLMSLFVLSGCGGKEAAAPSQVSPSRPVALAEPKVYAMKGVVRSIEVSEGLVTIRHEEIPGLMPAMTMPFGVADKAMLEDLEPGDEVEGKLTIGKGSSLLTELTVTCPALVPTLSLSPKGGLTRLDSKPKALTIGGLVPDFAMTTQEGKEIKLSELRGQVIVLTFIYTRCPLPEFCPLLDKKFRELAEIEGRSADRAKAVRLLSISFDPEHDTPTILAQHAKIQGAKPPLWTFAVASHDELSKVATCLGLMYGPTPNEIMHNRVVAVIAADGKLARLITGPEGGTWTAVDVSKTVRSLLPNPSK